MKKLHSPDTFSDYHQIPFSWNNLSKGVFSVVIYSRETVNIHIAQLFGHFDAFEVPNVKLEWSI